VITPSPVSVPLLTVSKPEQEFVPFSVSVPVPILVIEPLPVMISLRTMFDATLKTKTALFVITPISG
jgi:hypothetical protein